MPIRRESLDESAFTVRGSRSQVIRNMQALRIIPLKGSAHFSPNALASTCSRNPPLRIATGMKHTHTSRDFSIFIESLCIFCPDSDVWQAGPIERKKFFEYRPVHGPCVASVPVEVVSRRLTVERCSGIVLRVHSHCMSRLK